MKRFVALSMPSALLLAFLLGLLTFPADAAETTARQVKLWNLESLKKTPPAVWGAKKGLTQEVYYEGEPLAGKPTRVFA